MHLQECKFIVACLLSHISHLQKLVEEPTQIRSDVLDLFQERDWIGIFQWYPRRLLSPGYVV